MKGFGFKEALSRLMEQKQQEQQSQQVQEQNMVLDQQDQVSEREKRILTSLKTIRDSPAFAQAKELILSNDVQQALQDLYEAVEPKHIHRWYVKRTVGYTDHSKVRKIKFHLSFLEVEELHEIPSLTVRVCMMVGSQTFAKQEAFDSYIAIEINVNEDGLMEFRLLHDADNSFPIFETFVDLKAIFLALAHDIADTGRPRSIRSMFNKTSHSQKVILIQK